MEFFGDFIRNHSHDACWKEHVGGCKRLPNASSNVKLCTSTARASTTQCRAGGWLFAIALACRHRHAYHPHPPNNLSIKSKTCWERDEQQRTHTNSSQTTLAENERQTENQAPSINLSSRHFRNWLQGRRASSSAPYAVASNHDASAS